MRKNQSKLIVILGFTASGKSDLAVKIALRPCSGQAEIISADSRQVYRGMDVGTGKITKKEKQGIPHYCLDLVSPKYLFTVADFKKHALRAIDKIYKREKIPIICGGTGFYIQAVVEDLVIPVVKPDWKLRRDLEKKTTEELFKELKKLDPHRAKNIDSNNRRRLVRALEIVLRTGESVPVFQTRPKFDVLYIGIKKTKEELKNLIRKRLLRRIKQGMIAEVKKLRKSGVGWKRLDDFGLEYRYVAKYLKGELTKQKMIEQLQKEIEHYAKRQMTWFKKYPGTKVHWITNYKQAERLIKKFLYV